jgi:exonuclease VII small subunit
MAILKKIMIGLLVALVVIQFIRPAKNIHTEAMPQDIATVYPMPDSVHHILQVACYDCHSNNTRYPWYTDIQPVAWWLNDHVKEGKQELNFSEFGSFTTKRKVKKLQKIVHEVEDGGMPLDSYTWIHKDAVLSADEKKMLIEWAKGLAQQITVQTGYIDTPSVKKH